MLVGKDLSFLVGLSFTDVEDADFVRLKRRDAIQVLDGRLHAVGHQDGHRRRRLRRRSFLAHAGHRRVVQLQEHETGVGARRLRRLGRLGRLAWVVVVVVERRPAHVQRRHRVDTLARKRREVASVLRRPSGVRFFRLFRNGLAALAGRRRQLLQRRLARYQRPLLGVGVAGRQAVACPLHCRILCNSKQNSFS